jgi:glutaredoxin
MLKAMRFAALALLLLAAAPARAQMFTWTDADGVEHFSSEPPKEGAKVKNRKVERPDIRPIVFKKAGQALPARAKSLQPVKPQAAGEAPRVELYATSWCPVCRQARQYFADRSIAYVEYDVEKDEDAAARFNALGGGGVPIIRVGAATFKGFSREALDVFLARR